MKHLKMYEYFGKWLDPCDYDKEIEKMSDMFLEYADKWDLIEVDDLPHMEDHDIKRVEESGKIPYRFRFWSTVGLNRGDRPNAISNIDNEKAEMLLVFMFRGSYSDIDHGKFDDGFGGISQEFIKDLESFAKRIKREFGFEMDIDNAVWNQMGEIVITDPNYSKRPSGYID